MKGLDLDCGSYLTPNYPSGLLGTTVEKTKSQSRDAAEWKSSSAKRQMMWLNLYFLKTVLKEPVGSLASRTTHEWNRFFQLTAERRWRFLAQLNLLTCEWRRKNTESRREKRLKSPANKCRSQINFTVRCFGLRPRTTLMGPQAKTPQFDPETKSKARQQQEES